MGVASSLGLVSLAEEPAMDLGLQGRVAVVTGASKGIGLAVVHGLVAEGVHVLAGARQSSEDLDELADSGSVEVVIGDLAETEAIDRLVARAGQRLDILVNNVGAVTPRLGGFLEITDEQWFASLNLDLMSAVRTMRAALPVMLSAGRGAVVTVGSVNAFLPDPAVLDYGAAKDALVNVCKALSKEVGPRGVRVAVVNPLPVSSDLWLGMSGVSSTVAGATGRTPEDFAHAA